MYPWFDQVQKHGGNHAGANKDSFSLACEVEILGQVYIRTLLRAGGWASGGR